MIINPKQFMRNQEQPNRSIKPKLSEAPNKLIIGLIALISSMAGSACLLSKKSDKEDRRRDDYSYGCSPLDSSGLDEEMENQKIKALEHLEELHERILSMEALNFWLMAEGLKPLIKLLKENPWILKTKGGTEVHSRNYSNGATQIYFYQTVRALLDEKQEVIITKGKSNFYDKNFKREKADDSYKISILIRKKSGKRILEFIVNMFRGYAELVDHTRMSSCSEFEIDCKKYPVSYIFHQQDGHPWVGHSAVNIHKLIEQAREEEEFYGVPKQKGIDAARIIKLAENLPPEIVQLLRLLSIDLELKNDDLKHSDQQPPE